MLTLAAWEDETGVTVTAVLFRYLAAKPWITEFNGRGATLGAALRNLAKNMEEL